MDQWAVAFPMSLTGLASTWYHSQDPRKFKIWEETMQEFVNQFAYNLPLDVTIRDLETTRQKKDETFSEFIQRWKAKAIKVMARPAEEDQIRMIVKNLQPIYYDRLLAIPIATFKQLCNAGAQIEDAILEGKIGREDNRTWRHEGTSRGSAEVNAVNSKPFPERNTPRVYTDLGMSLSAALNNLTKSGKLKPLEPTPLPDPVPSHWNLNKFCHFHQRPGHTTDRCGHLKNEIQDLIDAHQKPNIIQNPLPSHQEKPNNQNAPPSLILNMISCDEPILTPITTINPLSRGK